MTEHGDYVIDALREQGMGTRVDGYPLIALNCLAWTLAEIADGVTYVT
jgi:hypothetical protein